MATSTTVRTRTALRRLARVLKEFATEQGWKPGEYQILFRVLENWGRISILYIVKEYGGLSEKEMWVRVWDFLARSLKQDGDLGFSVGLSVRDRQQVEQGGMYSIPEDYIEHDLLVGPGLGNRLGRQAPINVVRLETPTFSQATTTNVV
jgi:hypothetical protein